MKRGGIRDGAPGVLVSNWMARLLEPTWTAVSAIFGRLLSPWSRLSRVGLVFLWVALFLARLDANAAIRSQGSSRPSGRGALPTELAPASRVGLISAPCPRDTFAEPGQLLELPYRVVNDSRKIGRYCETVLGSRGWPSSAFIEPLDIPPDTTLEWHYPLTVPDSAAFGPNRVLWIVGCGAPGNDSCYFTIRVKNLVSVIRVSQLRGFIEIDGTPFTGTVFRREEQASQWSALSELSSGNAGRGVFQDNSISAGHTYGYRLRILVGQSVRYSGEVVVEATPAPEIELVGFLPNPTRDAVMVGFSVPAAMQGKLEIVDV